MTTVKLSAVIIAFNEEEKIGRCIDSLLGIADDIVVVDSYSTDSTRQICLEKGVRFVQHPFAGHIEQKNYAITQANYPHVLSLDADECLSDALKASVLQAKSNWQFDGYTMNRRNQYCGEWVHHSGWYPDRKLRLWDSRKGKWGGRNPHDMFLMDKACTIGHLSGDLLHYTMSSLYDHVDQVNKFSSIRAGQLQHRTKAYLWLRLISSPLLRFVKSYLLKLGFLDGFRGWCIAVNAAYAEFGKYSKALLAKQGVKDRYMKP